MFIIIKYRNRAKFIPEAQAWVYAKVEVKGVRTRVVTDIEKEEALALIEGYGLVLTLHDKEGKVWDTPDRAFQKAYGGGLLRFNKDEL